jgi:hypothetical protein
VVIERSTLTYESVVLKISFSFSHGNSMKRQSPCSLHILKTMLGVEVSTSINFKGLLKKAHLCDYTLGIGMRYDHYSLQIFIFRLVLKT